MMASMNLLALLYVRKKQHERLARQIAGIEKSFRKAGFMAPLNSSMEVLQALTVGFPTPKKGSSR